MNVDAVKTAATVIADAQVALDWLINRGPNAADEMTAAHISLRFPVAGNCNGAVDACFRVRQVLAEGMSAAINEAVKLCEQEIASAKNHIRLELGDPI